MQRRTDPPLYRRGDSPYWWTTYYQGSDRRRVSTKCTDRQAAIAAARELQRNSASPGRIHAGETVADALTDFLEAPGAWAPRTAEVYGQRAVNVARLLGPVRLADLGPEHIAGYICQRGAGKQTLQLELTVLRMALRLAARRGREVLPWDALKMPIPGKVEPKTRWLTPAEVQALCDALLTSRAQWVQVAVWTGARKSEVNSLDWADVDLIKETLHIRGTKTERSDRNIPLPAAMLDWLRSRQIKAGPLVRPWGSNMTTTLRRGCDRAKIAHCTPHDFRRTFASRLKQLGVDSMVVARLLGHTSSRLVDSTYGHLDLATMRAAMMLN